MWDRTWTYKPEIKSRTLYRLSQPDAPRNCFKLFTLLNSPVVHLLIGTDFCFNPSSLKNVGISLIKILAWPKDIKKLAALVLVIAVWNLPRTLKNQIKYSKIWTGNIVCKSFNNYNCTEFSNYSLFNLFLWIIPNLWNKTYHMALERIVKW